MGCGKDDCGKKKCYRCRQFITAKILFSGTCTEDKVPGGIIIVGTFNLVKEWGVVFQFTNGNWVAVPQTEDFFYICEVDGSIWFTKPGKPSKNIIDLFCARKWDTLFDCENGRFYVLMCEKIIRRLIPLDTELERVLLTEREERHHDGCDCDRCERKERHRDKCERDRDEEERHHDGCDCDRCKRKERHHDGCDCDRCKCRPKFKLVWRLECTVSTYMGLNCSVIIAGTVVQTKADLDNIVGAEGDLGFVIDTSDIFFWDGNVWVLVLGLAKPLVFRDTTNTNCMWYVQENILGPAVTYSSFFNLSPGAQLFDTVEGVLWRFIKECEWEKECQMLPLLNFLSITGTGDQQINSDGTTTVVILDAPLGPQFTWPEGPPFEFICISPGIYKVSYTVCMYTTTTGGTFDDIISEFSINGGSTSSGLARQSIMTLTTESPPRHSWSSTGFAILQNGDTLSLRVNRNSANLTIFIDGLYTILNAFKVKTSP